MINQIWTDAIVEESNLAHYLHVLRKTFGNRADGKPYIETLRRRGYRFNPVGEVRKEFKEISIEDDRPKNFKAPAFEKESSWKNDLTSSEVSENTESKPEKYQKTRFMATAFIGALIFGTIVFVYYQKLSAGAEAQRGQVKEMSIFNLTNNTSIFSAAISRDGKYFAYSEYEDKKYHLYLQQTGQPTRLEIIAPTEI